MPLSAVIITLNEESNIRRCLDSLAFCDELVVVDSGSTDNTVSIAKEYGAKVFHQDWLGYGEQKQYATEQADHDWVLCIDADEIISLELQTSIQQLTLCDTSAQNNKPPISAYRMPRRNHFLGKALRYGEGYPDLSLRLFHRQHGHWSKDKVHEGVHTHGKTVTLSGDLMHYSQETITAYLNKQNRYTELQAQALFLKGKRHNSLKCLTSPLTRFIKFYFIRLGFLDGLPGFIHISIGCFNAFCKYAKLAELQRQPSKNEKSL